MWANGKNKGRDNVNWIRSDRRGDTRGLNLFCGGFKKRRVHFITANVGLGMLSWTIYLYKYRMLCLHRIPFYNQITLNISAALVWLPSENEGGCMPIAQLQPRVPVLMQRHRKLFTLPQPYCFHLIPVTYIFRPIFSNTSCTGLSN